MWKVNHNSRSKDNAACYAVRHKKSFLWVRYMLCHATWAHIHLTKRKSAWRIEIKPYSLRLFCTHVIKKYQSFATTSQTFSILSVYKGGNTGYKGRLKTNFGLARFVGLSSRRKKTISIEAGDILGNLRARISDPWKKKCP